MIVEGRAALIERLEKLTACDVEHIDTGNRGGAVMDEFAFRRADIAHVDRIALIQKLRSLVDLVRDEEGVVLVYVDHRRYDWRAPGLDLTAGQCLLLSLVVLLASALAVFLSGIDLTRPHLLIDGLI